MASSFSMRADRNARGIPTYCKSKIAGYKVPKNIVFIKDEEMPRSGAGKILHRILRNNTACGRISNNEREVYMTEQNGSALALAEKYYSQYGFRARS
jgi:hypothetical protein